MIGIVILASICLIRDSGISADNARRSEGTHHAPRRRPTSPSCSPWVIPDWALDTELESALGLQRDQTGTLPVTPDFVLDTQSALGLQLDPYEVFGIDDTSRGSV